MASGAFLPSFVVTGYAVRPVSYRQAFLLITVSVVALGECHRKVIQYTIRNVYPDIWS